MTVMVNDTQRAKELFKAALQCEKKGEYANAIALLEESVAWDREYARAHNRLGLIYSRIENRQKAIESFTAAVKIAPDEKSCYNLAVEFYKAGEMEKTIATLNQCIEYNPSHIETRLLLAHINRKKGHDRESTKHLFHILQQEPKNRSALGALIVLYFDNGKYDECIQLADRYLKFYPKDTRIALIKTDSLLKLGNTRESVDLLKKITIEDPGFSSFTKSLKEKKSVPASKEFFQNLELKADKKLQEFEAKMEMSQENPEDFAAPDAQDAMDLSLLYLFKGDTEKALEYLVYARKAVEVQ